MSTARYISEVCDDLKRFLCEKNNAYGDSALDPVRIFSQASAKEQIRVRIDDKLSRLMRGGELPEESLNDTVKDLLGYLVLLLVAEEKERAENF